MITIIVFAIVSFFLLMKLNEIIGIEVGFKISKENLRDFSEADVKEISDVEKNLKVISSHYKKFDLDDFLKKSQRAFEMIFKAYSEGDKSTLKELLVPRTYQAFSMAIDDRNSRGEILEGNLVSFSKVELIDAKVENENIFVTVKFVTEQSNVLKTLDGKILEGSSDFVENRTDIWVFSRKIKSTDSKWFLYEIKSEE